MKKIINLFKNFFVPTEKNSMHPAGLSRLAFLTYLFIGLVLAVSSLQLSVSRLATPIDIAKFQTNQVINFINSSRADAGLNPLTENTKLYQAALRKAQDMFQRQYFSHATPDNQQPWVFIRNAEYSYAAAGENLAIDFLSAHAAHSALMASPTHRQNILNSTYEEIGIAVVPGNFEGSQSIIVVQFFAKPLIRQAMAAEPLPQQITQNTIAEKENIIEEEPEKQDNAQEQTNEEPELNDNKTNTVILGANSPTTPKTSENSSPQKESPNTSVAAKPNSSMGLSMLNPENHISLVAQVRIIALIIIGLLLIPTIFLVSRHDKVRPIAFVRPVLLITFYIYLGWLGGVDEVIKSKITPAPASTMQVSLLQF